MLTPGFGDLPRRVRWCDLLALKLEVPVLALHRVHEIRPEIVALRLQLGALLGELLDFPGQLLLSRRREVVDDTGDRLLELLVGLVVATQNADTEWLQRLREQAAHDPKCLGGVARDEDALVLREEVPDQVGDRVTLSGSRGSLHEDGAGLLDAADDLLLLGVGGLSKEEVDRRSCAVGFGTVAVCAGAAALYSDDAQQRLGQLGEVRQRLEVAVDVLAESQVPSPEVQVRLAIDVRGGRVVELLEVLDELAVRPEALHEVLEEAARGLPGEGVEVLASDGVNGVMDRLSVESHVAEERDVGLGVVLGVDDRELRDGGVEQQLDALDQHRVADLPPGVVEDEESVREEELVLLRLPVEPRAQVEQVGEDAERLDDAPLALLPLPLAAEPLVERVYPLLRVGERLPLERLLHHRVGVGVHAVPARLEPVLDDDRRLRAHALFGAPDLEDDPAARLVVRGRIAVAAEAVVGPDVLGAGEGAELEGPLPIVQADDRRGPNAMHLLEVPEHPTDSLPGGLDVVGHERAHLFPEVRQKS